MLTWKIITEGLDRNKYMVLAEREPDKEYLGFHTMLPGNGSCSSEYLYIAKLSVAKDKKLLPDTSLLLYCDPGEENQQDFEKYRRISNCIMITDESCAETVLDYIHHLFYVQSKASEMILRMLEASRDNCGIHRLVNMVAEQMCVPIDVMNTSLQFIANSDRTLNVTDIRDKFARPGGYLPSHFMKEFKASGKLRELMDVEECMMIEHPLYISWFVPLIVKGIKIGYLIAFDASEEENRTIKKEYLPYFSSFADIICIELCKTDYTVKNKSNYFSYILASILEGKNINREKVIQLLESYDYQLEKNIYLMAVERAETFVSEQSMMMAAYFLKDLFYNSIYTKKDNRLYFLMSRSDTQLISQDELELWNQHLSANQMYAGLTDVFYEFDEIQTRLEEADLLIEHRKRNQEFGLSFFPECQMKTLIEQIQQTGSLKHYCYPPVIRLKQYDEKHGGELVRTLRVYLENPREIERICSALHIHKNTLYKRLDRIKTVMGREFSGAEEIMRIQFTFHLLDVLERYQKKH